MNRGTAGLYAAVGALLWGTLGPVVHTWPGLGLGPTAFARSAVAGLTLAGVARRAAFRRLQLRRYRRALIVGGIGLAGYQYAYFAAVGESGVAASTVISIGLAPAVTGGWSWLTGTRPPLPWLAGTVLGVLGVALLVLSGTPDAHLSVLGVVWAVLAAAFFSAQIVAIHAIGADWTDAAALAWMFLIAAALLAPVVALTGPSLTIGVREIVVVGYLGAVTGGLAYWLFAAGTKIIGAATAATVSLLEPVGAVAIAVTLLAERQTPAQWVGIAVVIAGVAVATRTAPSQSGIAVFRGEARDELELTADGL